MADRQWDREPDNAEDDLVMGGVCVGRSLAETGLWTKIAAVSAIISAVIALATLVLIIIKA